MSSASNKAKGRRFQQEIMRQIAQCLKKECGKDTEIESRPMGQSGTDIRLSGEARELFDYACECKNSKTFNVPNAIRQGRTNQKKEGYNRWLCFFKNEKFNKSFVLLDTEEFFNIYRELVELRKVERIRGIRRIILRDIRERVNRVA